MTLIDKEACLESLKGLHKVATRRVYTQHPNWEYQAYRDALSDAEKVIAEQEPVAEKSGGCPHGLAELDCMVCSPWHALRQTRPVKTNDVMKKKLDELIAAVQPYGGWLSARRVNQILEDLRDTILASS